jgi:hypothetical protein
MLLVYKGSILASSMPVPWQGKLPWQLGCFGGAPVAKSSYKKFGHGLKWHTRPCWQRGWTHLGSGTTVGAALHVYQVHARVE